MKIDNRLKDDIPIDIIKVIEKLLKRVPSEHLVGLEQIIVCDYVTSKINKNNAAGIYNPKHNQVSATIELAIQIIYKKFPPFLFYVPFIYKFLLASALFHEIGHHNHYKMGHGVKKSEGEKYAEKYCNKMLKKTFFWWLIWFIPFAPLVHWLNRIVNKSEGHKG